MTQKTKVAASRKSARTKATQGEDTRIPPFVEMDGLCEGVAEAPSRATQAKAALIAIFQALPERCYVEALNALQAHWRNGMEAGFTKGFNAGWMESCNQTGEYRSLPGYPLVPRECTPPTWPDGMRGASVLDLVTCVLSLQAPCQKRGEQGSSGLIELQWGALSRIYSAAHAEGEVKGKRRAACVFALTAVGEEEASA